MQITLRPFDVRTDAGLIYATFSKGFFFGQDKEKKKESFAHFIESFSPQIQSFIDHSTITVASPKNDHSFLVGYSIITQGELNWVFVKPLYRKQGLATLLAKKASSVSDKYLTIVGREILKRKQHATPDPPKAA